MCQVLELPGCCATLLQAEQKMLAAGYNKEYLPIEGLDGFRKATVQLLLGADHPAVKGNKVAVVQVSNQSVSTVNKAHAQHLPSACFASWKLHCPSRSRWPVT